MAWSTVVGVALHGAVFALSPTWEVEDPSSEGASSGPASVELVQIAPVRLPDRGPVARPAPPRTDRERSNPDGGEPADANSGEIERERSASADGGPGAVPVERAVVAPPEPPEVREIALERLSAVGPELAVPAPSGWVLIRNRSDVHEFMRKASAGGKVDPSGAGSVSVRLWIDEKGSVEWARIADSSGRDDLDEIILDLFENIVSFHPAHDRGAPVPTTAVFSVPFPF